MKRNSRVLVVATLAGVLVAGTGSALAFGGCDGKGPGGRGGFGPVAAAYRLDDLTAEQRKQLDALRDAERKQRAQMRDERQALRDAMQAGADAKTLRPLAEKQGKNMTERIMHQAEVRAAVDKILTESQRKALAEDMQRGGSRGDRGRGKGW
jgi:Spy/CpxP family protein refolding chaperone